MITMSESANLVLSPLVKRLIIDLKNTSPVQGRVDENLQINPTGANVYYFYEKFRTAFEYREQHLFLRSAIARFLNRKLRFSKQRKNLGEDLLADLIKTRYIKNDSVPVLSVGQINNLIHKYLQLYNNSLELAKDAEEADALSDYIIEILSYDIERIIVPHPKEEVFVNFVYADMRSRIDTEKLIDFDSETYHTALYANIQRHLLKSDMPIIRYHLFYQKFPVWHISDEELQLTAREFYSFNTEIEKQLTSKLSARVSKIVRKHMPPFRVLLAMLIEHENPEELLNDTNRLHDRVTVICRKQYSASRRALKSSIIRSAIFIFLTKATLAILIEVPYDRIIDGRIHIVPLAINLTFPVLYMMLLGLTIKVPGDDNTKRMLSEIDRVISYENVPKSYKITGRPAKTKLNAIFRYAYLLSFIVSAAGLIALLRYLNFNIVAGLFFFVFLSTVSFFGLRISQSAKELLVIDEKQSLIGAIIDFIYTPFIRTGQWLSDKYSRVNIFNYALDVFLELPLKSVLRIFEQWVGFIRSKRDDLL